MAFRGTFDYTLDVKNRLTIPAKLPGDVRRRPRARPAPRHRELHLRLASRRVRRLRRRDPLELPSSLGRVRDGQPLLQLQLPRDRARQRRAGGGAGQGCSSRPASARKSSSPAPASASRSGTGRPGASTTAPWPPPSNESPRNLAILLDMTAAHVPVLAGELIEMLDPAPGQLAVDCTFGGGGHARLVADRIGPAGTLIAHRPRPGRRGALRRAGRARSPARPASSAPSFVDGARRCCATKGVRADHRLLRPRDVLDAGRHLGARLLLLLRRAARHADGPAPGADRPGDRQHLGRAPPRPAAARVRRGALRRPDRPARSSPQRGRGAARRRRSSSST